jgi:hypothetical protein
MREAWQLLNEKLANAVTGSPLYSGGMLISSSLQVPTPYELIAAYETDNQKDN